MGLFGKKACPRCGQEVHTMRDDTRKFSEGIICGDCTKPLSPNWKDTKKCTLADYDKHLAYRAGNLERLKNEFTPGVGVGEKATLFVDTQRRLWCISFAYGGYLEDNPDLFTYEQLKKFDFNTLSNSNTSYFTCKIIDHPYVDEVFFTTSTVPVSTMKDMCGPFLDIEKYNKEQRKKK